MPDKRYFKKLELVSEQIAEAYKNGMTLEEIATLHECSLGTVRNILISNGVERRKRGRRKNVNR